MTHIIHADVLDALRQMPSGSVHCAITSPTYFGLRSYLGLAPTQWSDGTACCLGSEPTPDAFVRHIVEVFDEVRRVLRDDGCAFVNLGDTYANAWACSRVNKIGNGSLEDGTRDARPDRTADGTKEGSMLGIPWRCALALQESGWSLRSEVVWHKTSAMPASLNGVRWERCKTLVGREPVDWSKTPKGWDVGEGAHGDDVVGNFRKGGARVPTVAKFGPCPGCEKCRDNGGYILRRGAWRPTTAHEPIFMLTKGMDYFCDRDAVATPLSSATVNRDQYTRIIDDPDEQFGVAHDHESIGNPAGANMRTVQTFNRSGPKYEFCYGCRKLYVGAEVRPSMTKKECPNCGKKDWVAYYAAFPLSLPSTFIKASCSEAGCCGKCGKQWARVVSESSGGSIGQAWLDHADDAVAGNFKTASSNGYKRGETLGFRATCNCPGIPDSSPPVVLDPFAGTGTTLIAGLAHGCEAIGIEGSAQYAALAEARIERWKLFAELAEVDREKAPCVGQQELFT